MALVAYSDSEGSEDERTTAPVASTKPATKISDKPAFQKITNASEPHKIKVDLPSVKPDSTQRDEQQPPTKRARTAGAFSGFNSLLPAPKQPAKSAPKAGVSLKTSSEAVFSRAPPTQSSDWNEDDEWRDAAADGTANGTSQAPSAKEEPKLVGKATKFKPLSVSNRKKPVKKSKPIDDSKDVMDGMGSQQQSAQKTEAAIAASQPLLLPKPKRSLFSVPKTEEGVGSNSTFDGYDAVDGDDSTDEPDTSHQPQQSAPLTVPISNSNSLQSIASDLDLTPAQRRQLFGRHGQNQDINITHFNLESEYAANEQLRQAGEVVEHRAVKAIAPGKHSLQQLVNNARSQQDGLEDKWAAGRQARGEGGSKYGWGR
jgi:hypothetical protein